MRMTMKISAPCLVLALGILASASRAEDTGAVFDALFPDGRRTEALATLAASERLSAEEDFKLSDLGRDAHSSHHLVWIRDREVPHRHDRHDLVAIIVRGHGFMRLGEEERAVGEGSILYVPRGTVHAFRNTSAEPAVAYAIYVPAFDGKDKVPVDAGD